MLQTQTHKQKESGKGKHTPHTRWLSNTTLSIVSNNTLNRPSLECLGRYSYLLWHISQHFAICWFFKLNFVFNLCFICVLFVCKYPQALESKSIRVKKNVEPSRGGASAQEWNVGDGDDEEYPWTRIYAVLANWQRVRDARERVAVLIISSSASSPPRRLRSSSW